jgi:hypothetical protein
MKITLVAGLLTGLLVIAMSRTTTTTPEPATMLLFGSALIAIAGFSKNKSQKK